MSNEYVAYVNQVSSRRANSRGVAIAILFVGLAAALGANAYQYIKGERLAREVTQLQRSLQAQITRLSDATSGAFEVTQQRFEDTKKVQDSITAALANTQKQLNQTDSQVDGRLEAKNRELVEKSRELMAQLASVRQDLDSKLQSTSTKLQSTSAKLETTTAKLDNVSIETDNNRADLKRVAGDLSAVQANMPRNAAPLAGSQVVAARPVAAHNLVTASSAVAVTPEPESRSYFPFDLLTTKVPTRIAEIQIAIRSADPKKNRYTIDVYQDDKLATERDCAVNEAVQFYRAGMSLPYRVVVSQVLKDEVIGYVLAPKIIAPKLQTAKATVN